MASHPRRKRWQRQQRSCMNPLIPPLPDEVALLCLARVPHESRTALRCVSRAWRRALGRPKAPRLLICGGCPMLGTGNAAIWYVFDPVSCQWDNIPPPSPLPPSSNIRGSMKRSEWAFSWRLFKVSCPDAEVISMYGPSTFCLKVEEAQEEEQQVAKHSGAVFRARYSWSLAESMIEKSRWLYGASASEDGKFVYVAGGVVDRLKCSGPYLRSAERFNVKTRQWEPLPPFFGSSDRLYAYSRMLWEDRFCISGTLPVVGNERIQEASGKAFDPVTWQWSRHYGCPVSPHSDLKGVLCRGRRYCIQIDYRRSEVVLMLCADPHKRLSVVPVPYCGFLDWVQPIAVGHALVVLSESSLFITSPSVLPLQWTRVSLPCREMCVRSLVVFGGEKDPKSGRRALPVNFSLDLTAGRSHLSAWRSHLSLEEMSEGLVRMG